MKSLRERGREHIRHLNARRREQTNMPKQVQNANASKVVDEFFKEFDRRMADDCPNHSAEWKAWARKHRPALLIFGRSDPERFAKFIEEWFEKNVNQPEP